MSPEEIRDQVDSMHERMVDGHINSAHVAAEQTLRRQYGHPAYIIELDGAGKFYPPTTRTSPVFAALRQLAAQIPSNAELYEQQRTAVIAMLAERHGIRAYRNRSGITIGKRAWTKFQAALAAESPLLTRISPDARVAAHVPPISMPISIAVGNWWTIARLRFDEWRAR